MIHTPEATQSVEEAHHDILALMYSLSLEELQALKKNLDETFSQQHARMMVASMVAIVTHKPVPENIDYELSKAIWLLVSHCVKEREGNDGTDKRTE